MVQPRVGRRRVVDSSSDDESEAGSTRRPGKSNQDEHLTQQKHTQLPSRSRLQPPLPSLSQAFTTSLSLSPENTPKKKTIKVSQKDVGKKTNTKTLYSFFNNATQKLQLQTQLQEQPDIDGDENLGDAIQDDFSDADSRSRMPAIQPLSRDINKKKRYFSSIEPSIAARAESTMSSQGQKFYKVSNGSRAVVNESQKEDPVSHELRPWPEEYAPATLEELVVHKKKVSDVHQWLSAALAGHKYKKLLVLKGPAGSGKTITFSLLAKSLGAQVVEWRNPSSHEFSSDDYVSISGQFEDFLGRGKQFGSLDFDISDEIVNNSDIRDSPDQIKNNKRIVLVEEIPYTLLRASSALQSFRSTLLQFLAVSSSSESDENITPIVFIVSESDLSRNADISDNLTAYRLLGSEILHHPSTVLIEFNAVAPTFISRALNLVIQKHHVQTGKQFASHPDVIKKISEIGDVRNAVSTLEFISAHPNMVINGPSVLPKTRPRTSKAKALPQSASVRPSHEVNLSLIGLRESTIGLFHAIGKVVYNKRSSELTSTSASGGETQLPDHASHLARPFSSEVDIATLMDETGTDTSTFLSALHENCTLSCYDPSGDTEATLNILNDCLDALGNADVLVNPVLNLRGGTSEGVRQEEIAFETGVRGLLFSLPSPVKRQPYPGKSKLDSHKMFYPTGLRIWRKREELLGLVDMFIERAMAGNFLRLLHPNRSSGNTSSISQPGRIEGTSTGNTVVGLDRWKQNRQNNRASVIPDDSQLEPYLAMGSGHSARHEMLLERLPYINRITTGVSKHFTHNLQRQIEQLTRFTGIGTFDEDEDTSPASDGMFGSIAKGGTTATAHFHAYNKHKGEELDVRGLVLSDDDIEDD